MSCLLKVSTVRWEQLPKSESSDLKREISFDRLKVWSVIRSPGQMASLTSCKERGTPCIDCKVITRGGSAIMSKCGIANATVCEAFATFVFPCSRPTTCKRSGDVSQSTQWTAAMAHKRWRSSSSHLEALWAQWYSSGGGNGSKRPLIWQCCQW